MKRILDACCGSRMCWFDKDNTEALFMDIRQETTTLCDGRTLTVCPDVVGDFRNMPFDNESFNLVLFDPPHLKNLGKSSWMANCPASCPPPPTKISPVEKSVASPGLWSMISTRKPRHSSLFLSTKVLPQSP